MRTDHAPGGILVQLPKLQLYVVVRGERYPLTVLHGGPGLDHYVFKDYFDPLANQFCMYIIEQRGQGRSTPHPLVHRELPDVNTKSHHRTNPISQVNT
ncbi:MAG: hypothetical protein KAT29_00355, partial [Anaerolineales bacterium]|nr:hypothetical protein [Anaerolineales bacterium]